jgi:cytochrome P450
MQLSEVDLNNPDNFLAGQPHEAYDLLRREAPVFWHDEPDGPGFWVLTRHEDVRYVSRTPSIFSSTPHCLIWEPDPELIGVLSTVMINMDPPRHNQYRNTINKGFVPKRIDQISGYVAKVAKDIVDEVAPKGECDFVEEVAALTPMTMICELFGIPESERRYAYDLANRLISSDDPEMQEAGGADEAFAEIFEYAAKLRAYKLEHPSDDLATLVVNAELDGKRVDDMVFGSFVMMMVVAGNETTRTVTSNGMIRLIEHPEQRQQLIDDPSLIPAAVEELLRYEPGVHHFRRTVMEDTEVAGVKMEEGQKLTLWYGSANRDDSVFKDPHNFDINRSDATEHVTFGIGQHYCLGASLARAQLRAIFTEVLTRMPDIEMVGTPRRLRSNFINGVKEMRVSYTPS